MSSLKSVSPEQAAELMRDGAILVDVREAHEHQREHIPGAHHHALTQIDPSNPIRSGDAVLIFHCRSGARTNTYASHLAAAAGQCEVYVLDGGIEAWKRAGLPVKA
jgi:rhodanese-related sulfurtransferase